MFSGLVKGLGAVLTRADRGGDCRFVLGLGDTGIALEIGGSIAVDGVCLTAVAVEAGRCTVDVSAETLGVTTLGRLARGAKVNLEPPLKAGDPLDGHLVTGHVDGVGEVVSVEPVGQSLRVVIELPPGLARYVAAKGSVAVDGVSLTVNAVAGSRFEVNVIPHTQAVTVIGEYRLGRAVNIEVDLIARYVERLAGSDAGAAIDLQLLKKHGYARND